MENMKVLQEVMKEVLRSTYLTENTDKEVKIFIESGDFNVLSPNSKRELSFLYESLILPIYKHLSNGDYIPNIFVSIED